MSFPGFTLRGRTRRLVLGIAALVAAPSLEAAAQGRSPSTPRAEHERLTFLEGTWTRTELPAGESVREACAWLP